MGKKIVRAFSQPKSPVRWLRWTGDESTPEGAQAVVDGHTVTITWGAEGWRLVHTHTSGSAHDKTFKVRDMAFKKAAEWCGVGLIW